MGESLVANMSMTRTLATATRRISSLTYALKLAEEEYRVFGAGQPDRAKRTSLMSKADLAKRERELVRIGKAILALEAALVVAEKED